MLQELGKPKNILSSIVRNLIVAIAGRRQMGLYLRKLISERSHPCDILPLIWKTWQCDTQRWSFYRRMWPGQGRPASGVTHAAAGGAINPPDRAATRNPGESGRLIGIESSAARDSERRWPFGIDQAIPGNLYFSEPASNHPDRGER